MRTFPYRIGITGGIATGKSTAISEIKRLGCPVIDADDIAKSIFHKWHVSYYLVWLVFGSTVFTNNQVDRQKLGSIVFNNAFKLKQLNLITHPFVILKMVLLYLGYVLVNKEYVFFDIPLLYESNLDKYMNQIWVIYVPLEIQKLRLVGRMRHMQLDSLDDLTREEEDMLKRIDHQLSIEKKKEMANVIVKNVDTPNELKERIQYLVASLDDQ